MKNRTNPAGKVCSGFEDLIGLWEISSLDNLLASNTEQRRQQPIPTYLVTEVLNKELSSAEVASLLKDVSVSSKKSKLRELPTIKKRIPDKLYFFLWSLTNSEVLPQDGIISSFELKTAVYNLAKFLALLRRGLRKTKRSFALHENLGYAYLDLAGLARFSQKGLLIGGRHIHYTFLLREAVYSFQNAVRLSSKQAKAIDSSHIKILGIVDDDVDLPEHRTNLYLNPWHFLYISQALQLLNDIEVGELYLEKARVILNSINDHQNPNIVKQKELLESVYAAIYFGKSLTFDFDKARLINIQRKLKRIRKTKKSANRRRAYSPIVEKSLKEQYRDQRAFLKNGKLDSDQFVYLKRVYSLYQQLESAKERDRLIYRLNIPPIKVKGLNRPLRISSSQRQLSPPNGSTHLRLPIIPF